MVSSCSNSDDDCRWVQRDFLKEKLRVRERYWHPISSEGSESTANVSVDETINCIIPDGLAWRIYLPLITYLVEREEEHYKKIHLSVEHRSQRCCLWVLLESVTDWMDHRSISSATSANSIDMPPETPIPHERAKIQTLIQQHTDTVKVFCDLSVREGIGIDSNEDEWDLMRYENMSMCERSENALFRAGRLLRQYRTNTTKCSWRFFILSGDQNFVQRFPEEDGTQTILMKDLFEILHSKSRRDDMIDHSGGENAWLTEENLEHAKKLAIQCEEDYNVRNDPKRKSKSLSSVLDTGVEEYWTEDRIQEGLRNKTLFKGKLNVTKDNIKEAVVLNSGGAGGDSSSLFVNQARGYFNRAMHQDLVIVQVLPKKEWTSPVGRRRLVHVQPDGNDNSNTNDTRNEISSDGSPPVPSGRVVAIAKECRRYFVATMVDTPMNDESYCFVVPMDVRIPKIRIKTNGWRRFLGQRLRVQAANWEVGSNYPSGRCVEILGPIGDLETEIKCLLKENQIQLDPFSAAAQACLPLEGHDWKIPSHEIDQRKDLRSTRRIFSVDPNGCQDIDDTFHCHLLPNGDAEVGVHIADVTHFLPHDSALDKEAQKRATTFYLVDRRFDMLPGVLSSDLCSLHGNVDRLAVSTIWTISSDLKTIKSFWYGRTVIRNCQAMTYDQAHNIIHNKPPDDPSKPPPPPLTAGYHVSRANIGFLREDLSILTKLARRLRKDREDIGGAVDLSSGDHGNELKFSLDENHNPVSVTPKKQLEIHQTVAGMLLDTYKTQCRFNS
jgi:exoribonuclease R